MIVEAEVQPAATPAGPRRAARGCGSERALRNRWNWAFRVGIGQSAKTAKRKGS
jgi:hypothetical protein